MRRPLLLVLLVLATLGPAPAGAAEERSWRGLDVPYVARGTIHFQGNRADEWLPGSGDRELVVMTATRRSAILQSGADSRGVLHELPAGHGRPRLLTRRLVGVPLADPAGDWVFWTADRRRGPGVRLVGYDTRRDVLRRGPVLGRNARVTAVDGRTAYVGRALGYVSWTPGGRPIPIPRSLTGRLFLSDVDHGRYVLTDLSSDGDGDGTDEADGTGAQVRAADGTVLAETGLFGDTFDPTGRYLFTGDSVWDSESRASVPLRTGRGWALLAAAWTPAGELVVILEEEDPQGEHTRIRRLVCDPATGSCDRLRGPRTDAAGGEVVYAAPFIQFGLALAEAIGYS